ncbi:MAG: PAS domain-containing protein [Campylobacterota bacterium]|nr:PAS domain-containing protein [Campylobacterota bacterium]
MQNIMKKDDFIVSKTDLKGNITYCNEIFIKFSGLSERELLGKPHNIIRHPDMPRVIFKLLWDRIKNRKEIFAYVKNRSVDGNYYWVYANVTASIDFRENIIGYYSVRRKPNNNAINIIENLYKRLLEKEREGGIEESFKYLTKFLKSEDMNYDEYINFLQNGAL